MTDAEAQRGKRSYRLNPDFVRPEPSAAEFHSYWPHEEHSFERYQQALRLMAENGAQFFRATIVDEEHPLPPYPNGVWLEGWRNKFAVPIDFGTANPKDSTISPPLTYAEPRP